MNIPPTEEKTLKNGNTLVSTYDEKIAREAENKFGKSARSFQKSSNDGLPDLYFIYSNKKGVYDIIREYSAIF